MAKKIHNPYFSTISATIIITIITLFQGIILARMLGPEGRGIFFQITAIPIGVAAIGLWGIENVIARRVMASKNNYTLFSIVISIFTSLISAIGVVIVWKLNEKLMALEYKELCYLFLLFLPLNHISVNMQAIDQGKLNYSRINLCRLAVNPVFLIGIVFVWIFVDDKIIGSIAALLVANIAAVIVRLTLVDQWDRWIPNKFEVIEIIKDSVAYGFNNISFMILSQIDKFIIIYYLDRTQLGQYSTALGVASAAGMINNAVGYVSFSEGMKNNKDGYEKLKKTFILTAVFSLICYVIGLLVLPFLYPLFYGRDFSDGLAVAYILIASVIVMSLAKILEQYIKGNGSAKIGMYASISASVVYAATALIFKLDSAVEMAFISLFATCIYFLIVGTYFALYLTNKNGNT